MEFHRGRLFDHIHLRVTDVKRSRNFYSAIFAALGKSGVIEEGEGFFYVDELFVDKAEDKVSNVHLAFQAESKEMVDTFYEAGISAGGSDNGKPGERGYHPGYYAAFVLDPDGNNIEAVYHGPMSRSVESVIIRPE